MMSEQDLIKLIKETQQLGEVSFKSSHISGDRQKLYRMKKEYEEEFPLLAATWNFSIKHIKPDIINLKMKNNEAIVRVDTAKKEEAVIAAKPKKQPKMLAWIEKELRWIGDAERLYKEKIGAVPKDAAEFFETRKTAAQYYMELFAEGIEDDGLEKVIRHSSAAENFIPLVMSAYGFADYRKAKTIDDQIIENARLIAETDDGPLLTKLVEMQERLRQRRDEELSKKDILG